jgi:Mg/Co/Ni transporter MgtE
VIASATPSGVAGVGSRLVPDAADAAGPAKDFVGDLGGHSGSQATTLIIRAMALGEVRLRDWVLIVRRELAAGLALGLILASIGLLRIIVWQGSVASLVLKGSLL